MLGHPIPPCPFYAPIKAVQFKNTATGIRYTTVIQTMKKVIERFCQEFGVKWIKFKRVRDGVVLLFVDDIGILFERGFALVHRSCEFFSEDNIPLISDLCQCLKIIDKDY